MSKSVSPATANSFIGATHSKSLDVMIALSPSGVSDASTPANDSGVRNPYVARYAGLNVTSTLCVRSKTRSTCPFEPHVTSMSAARRTVESTPSSARAALVVVRYALSRTTS